ncbi:MAG TPA: PEP-CTERM sorting domain-containing protein [Steroidobacteraceae bacterium]|nr:PEP-CTERM sorting domain-containing protein [Steroidobacteraceae bacterium]
MLKTQKFFGLFAVAALALGSAVSQAALIDRGGGLIYDDVLDVTWLQDVRYAVTTGAAPYGSLTWGEAKDFIDTLAYVDTARGVVWDDWRLPQVFDAGAEGYDLTGASSELAYMYYVNLGYEPDYDPHTWDPPPPSNGAYNPFINMSYRAYWTGTAGEFAGRAWYQHFHFGFGGVTGTDDYHQVWAVRDGDVAGAVSSVPEPGTLGLFGAALGLAGFLRRRRSVAVR